MTVDLNVLRKATEELLCSRGVFDVDAYGWLNEDDVDPEFVGYAMWALSPPYDHHLVKWNYDTLPSRAPTEAEQRLMELGHDFFGLMKTARHFIGDALLHQPAVRPLRIHPTEFDFNEFAALAALTAAADRLRDFIIVTALEIKPKSGNQAWEQFKTIPRESSFRPYSCIRAEDHPHEHHSRVEERTRTAGQEDEGDRYRDRCVGRWRTRKRKDDVGCGQEENLGGAEGELAEEKGRKVIDFHVTYT